LLINYLKIAIRFLKRNKAYSLINILGLAIGFAASLLIFSFIHFEQSFDRYHPDSNRIFRVVVEVKTKNGIDNFATTPPPLAPALKNNFSQVKSAIRFFGNPQMPVRFGTKNIFYESRFYFVDSDVFDIFKTQFIKGDPKTALNRPGTVVITKSIAKKYFGDEEPLGKSLFTWRNFEVTGVIEDIPENSHLKFDFLSSSAIFENQNWTENWSSIHAPNGWIYTYLKVNENCDVNLLATQVEHISDQYFADQIEATGYSQSYLLQPIHQIHLHSHRSFEAEPPGDVLDIRILSGVTFFIMLIACINFMYLSTAGSVNRAKEIAIRKVSGANRQMLIRQFLSESILLILIALVIALGIVELSFSWFSNLSGKHLSFTHFPEPQALLLFFGFLLVIWIFAGSYIAFVISSFQPIFVLNKRLILINSQGSILFRKSLVVCQFVISIILIIGTLIVYQQVQMMKNKQLGFDKEQLLVLSIPVSSLFKFINNYEAIKTEFTAYHSIVAATASASVPGRVDMMIQDKISLSEDNKNNPFSTNVLIVDFDFLSTYNIDVFAGRPFLRDGSKRGILINETVVKTLGWKKPDEAVGKTIFSSNANNEMEIIGVCRDFNYESLYKPVEPLILDIFPDCFVYLSLKLDSSNPAETISFIKNKWAELFPGNPFDYFFLNDTINQQYQAIERFGKIVLLFSALTIFIASLGLYGLIFFLTQQRTKEIGIRKVLGASVPGIFILFTKQIVNGILIAALIACPVAFYLMNKWLQNFTYRIQINFWIFLLSTFIVLAIALFTVGYKSIRAAMANSVDSLRWE